MKISTADAQPVRGYAVASIYLVLLIVADGDIVLSQFKLSGDGLLSAHNQAQ